MNIHLEIQEDDGDSIHIGAQEFDNYIVTVDRGDAPDFARAVLGAGLVTDAPRSAADRIMTKQQLHELAVLIVNAPKLLRACKVALFTLEGVAPVAEEVLRDALEDFKGNRR